jgi:hypothetical protein
MKRNRLRSEQGWISGVVNRRSRRSSALVDEIVKAQVKNILAKLGAKASTSSI